MVKVYTLALLFCSSLLCFRPSNQQGLDLLVEPLSVTSLGRVALLGELYDARRDTFLGMSLFDNRLPKELVTSTENRHSDIKYLMLNTLEEKMSILDVRAEAKLSLLWGIIEVSGSAKFFSDKRKTSHSVKVSLANLVKTEYEQINLSGEIERKFIDKDLLQIIEATHVVVGIQWGGNVFISVEDSNSANKDQLIVQGSLGGKLTFLMQSISVNGSVALNDEEISEYAKFSFELYGDVLLEQTPTTLVDAVKLMKSSSSMLAQSNSGKGKQISYFLLPIGVFRELLNVEGKVNTILKDIDSMIITSCMQLFEEMEDIQRKIDELMTNRKAFEKYVVKEKLDNISQLANAYSNYKATLIQELGATLISVRSGNASAQNLIDTIQAARQDELSPNNIDFQQFFSVEAEFRFLDFLASLDITVVTKEKSFEEFMSENFSRNIYAFFYTVEYPTLMQKPMSVFLSLSAQRESFDPNGIFVAIKLDTTRDNERQIYFDFVEPTRLRVYKNGICVSDNYSENSEIEEGNNPELWSFHHMQTQIATLLQKTTDLSQRTTDLSQRTTDLSQRINNNFENSVPIGFVYVQYPGMSPPSDIWPTFNWTNITANFANGFFRAEGSKSASFGASQSENAPRIIGAKTAYEPAPNQWSLNISTVNAGWGPLLALSGKTGVWRTIQFNVQGGEVRPMNYAIRIWKRVS